MRFRWLDGVKDQPLMGACRLALLENLGLSAQESVLIVYDKPKKQLAEVFRAAAEEVCSRVTSCAIPVAERNGMEPPQEVARLMAQAEVVLLLVSRSLSWTRARVEACRAGARIASMATITREIILRTFPADYSQVRDRVGGVCDRLDAGEQVQITSDAGTDLHLSIAGRQAHGRKGGIYRSPGHWGNLPCGEAFIAPVEGSAEGMYVVDGSHSGIGRVTEPLRITVRQGLAVAFDGGVAAEHLQAQLAEVGDPQAFNLAELGIGCHPLAQVSGVTLEDEKALGTCHLALGNNVYFGGKVCVDVHLDGVLKRPSIWIDRQPLLLCGELTAKTS